MQYLRMLLLLVFLYVPWSPAHADEWHYSNVDRIVAVGDVSMGELVTALEASYGGWGLPANAAPGKAIRRPAPAPQSRLIVIDRPNSPSTYLMLGRMTPIIGHADGIETVDLANEVVGSTFLSRLNADLRETKGWTYSVRSEIPSYIGQRVLRISTQVQADRTADSIHAIIDQLAAFPTQKPVDPVELQRVTDGNIRGLPNRFETNGQVLGALLANRILGRDERYQAQLPALYRAIDADAINAAARDFLQPDDFTIVVVGDRKVIEEQLETLGMAIEYRSADEL